MKLSIGQKELEGKAVGGVLAGILVLLILLSAVFFFVGRTGGIAVGMERKVDQAAADALERDKKQADSDYKTLTVQVDDLKKQLQDNQQTVDAMNQYNANKEALDAEIAEKNATVQGLNTDISAKQAELDRLTGDIIKAKDAPKVLPAGHYTVGTDLPEGRYSVTGSSNFVVYSSSGSLKVNTILGGGRWGEDSYTCYLSVGDTIEAESRTTFTPVA